MNIWYAIQESPHKWLILASISFLAGLVGTMAMIAWNWSHDLARVWIYAGLLTALYCLIRLVLQWKQQLDVAVESEDRPR